MTESTKSPMPRAYEPMGSRPHHDFSLATRLSVMMLLQYAVWGMWLQYVAVYLNAAVDQGGLGFSQTQISWILGLAASIGAVSAPFIAGQVADRIMNAERALAALLLLGGAANIVLAKTTTFWPFLGVSIVYSVLYMPTLSLTNSICFQNLSAPEKQFPPIRLWGTIGWIAASLGFSRFWLNTPDATENTRRIADALVASGVLSLLYGVYAFVALPKTPPQPSSRHPLAFLEAFALLKNPAFLVVTLVALPIAMIHQVYFIRGGIFFTQAVGVAEKNLGYVFGIGQASEIFFLLVLGHILKKTGYKGVLMLGCLAYAVRFGIFAIGEPHWFVVASQVLHGLCYGCFFAGSFLLVEKIAGESIRHSAQTVFGIIILGLGPILAGVYNPQVLGRFDRPDHTTDYRGVWAVQSGVAVVSLLILGAAFRFKPNRSHETTAAEHHEGHLA